MKKDIVTQLENLKLWSQNPTAYAKKISKEIETPKQKWNRLADDARRQVDESGFTNEEIKKRLDKIRGPHDFEVIWESMSPIERGQFNAQRRKHGEPIYVQKKIKKEELGRHEPTRKNK